MLKIKLKDLTELNTPGVYALINNKDKRIFITQSNNILSSVSRNIAQIRDKSHSCRPLLRNLPNLELLVLEHESSPKNRKIRLSYWMTIYKTKGYELYNPSTPVSYKVQARITSDYFVHVLLINKRNDKLVVGVFNTMSEAESFISQNYPNQSINNVIYSSNDLTKSFYNKGKDIRV